MYFSASKDQLIAKKIRKNPLDVDSESDSDTNSDSESDSDSDANPHAETH